MATNFIEYIDELCESYTRNSSSSDELCPPNRPVDILRIGAQHVKQHKRPFKVVYDASHCQDRLYGGFFNDWVCGGQWGKMLQFLTNLGERCCESNIELVIFINGALEYNRLNEWHKKQIDKKPRIYSVFNHIYNKGTPPPKVWWLAPAGLETALRLALVSLKIPVVVSLENHKSEIINYCKENNFNGVIAHDIDFLLFDPPRLFSSLNLKLSYSGHLESTEYSLSNISKLLNLSRNQMCLVSSLLGTHLLSEEKLKPFYFSVCMPNSFSGSQRQQLSTKTVIEGVLKYVRGISPTQSLDDIGAFVFRNIPNPKEIVHLTAQLKKSVFYYMNCGKETEIKQPCIASPEPAPGQPGVAKQLKNDGLCDINAASNAFLTAVEQTISVNEGFSNEAMAPMSTDVHYSGYQTNLRQPQPYPGYRPKSGQPTVRQPLIGQPNFRPPVANSTIQQRGVPPVAATLQQVPQMRMPFLSQMQNGAQVSPLMRPAQPRPVLGLKSTLPPPVSQANAQLCADQGINAGSQAESRIPETDSNILGMAQQRHKSGLMFPFIYHILKHGEIKLDVSFEPETSHYLPTAVELYRPVRQLAYSILFNLNVQGINMPSQGVSIKEWEVNQGQTLPYYQLVPAVRLPSPTPRLNNLWFGMTPEDSKQRLRIFLTCFHSDSASMLNTSLIPSNLLVPCVILRYLIQSKSGPVISRHELDAFLVASVSGRIWDHSYIQDLKLERMRVHSIQLAMLFMRGFEAAVFINDVCGSPISPVNFFPWKYFNGKLFQSVLERIECGQNLMSVCDGQSRQIMMVERMRNAIMDGVHTNLNMSRNELFAESQKLRPSEQRYSIPSGGESYMRAPQPQGRGRGRFYSEPKNFNSRSGGQLLVAGVTTGKWGANTPENAYHPNGQFSKLQPHRGMKKMLPSGKKGNGKKKGTVKKSAAGRPAVSTKIVKVSSITIEKRRLIKRIPGTGRGCTIENSSDDTEEGETEEAPYVEEEGDTEEAHNVGEEQTEVSEQPDTLQSETADGRFADSQLDQDKKLEPINPYLHTSSGNGTNLTKTDPTLPAPVGPSGDFAKPIPPESISLMNNSGDAVSLGGAAAILSAGSDALPCQQSILSNDILLPPQCDEILALGNQLRSSVVINGSDQDSGLL